MKTPELAYIAWSKAMPAAAVNLARSGIDHCPRSLLGLRASDLVTQLPVQYGYVPLSEAIARRYDVSVNQVFTVSGGTSLANWVELGLKEGRLKAVVATSSLDLGVDFLPVERVLQIGSA